MSDEAEHADARREALIAELERQAREGGQRDTAEDEAELVAWLTGYLDRHYVTGVDGGLPSASRIADRIAGWRRWIA
jgi:hypothetical protein